MAVHKFKLIIITVILFSLAGVLIGYPALADNNILDSLQNSGGSAGYSTFDQGGFAESILDTYIGLLIAVVLGFVGVIFLILIIYSGIQWMTAGGNEETVTKAKKRLTQATIGIIIIFGAWIITNFIYVNLFNITVGQS